MSNATPEKFALTRHGLPLPAIKPAPLRSAWLPSAVRNPAATQADDPDTPAAPADLPQATDDQPWWMEAADCAPRETASETAMETDSPRPNPPGLSTDTARARAELAPIEPRLVANAEREALQTVTNNVPDGPQRGLEPGHLTEASVDAPNQAATSTTSPTPTPTPTPPTPTPTLASTPAPAPAPVRATVRHHASDAQLSPQHATPDPATALTHRQTAPEPGMLATPAPTTALGTIKHLYKTIETVVRDHAPLAWPTLRQVQLLRGTPTRTPETAVLLKAQAIGTPAGLTSPPRARANPSRSQTTPQPQAMGMPQEHESASAQARATTSGHTRATPADMANLLSPAPRRQQQVYIDQITVTVQTPPATPPAAPRAEPASLRAPSAGRSYRNPWSGYHARRD